ncbi:predicted protein [Naegleria gruberi]|uniref:Predicted protein n=1 Tax=Naegleria gruberi TaxID=5762 RepID=D2V0E3_NAEGR|nr:uncharacterized protein NAEGRDRAFT_62264 [Naegleria gruberi]EFC49510.1 predicted protein [Naegleria gruberi]|eukprot:XP_002682254.1 predicted protein [Naegleria gruberi strain NEG-M]
MRFTGLYRTTNYLRNNALGKVASPSSTSSTTSTTTSTVKTAAKKSDGVIRGSAVAVIGGAAIFGSAYYYLRDLMESETNQLIEKTKSIESLKTKRQLLEEEKREIEKEHEKLLKKRELANQLPEEKDQASHKLLLLKFYRNWNSIFYGVSSEIDSQNQKKQQERMSVMRSRVEEEVQSKFSLKDGQYKIKTIQEE